MPEKKVTDASVKGKTWVAKAEALVINVGTKAERYIYKNAVIPAETDVGELARLVRRGLVVEQPKAGETSDGDTTGGNANDGTGTPPAQS